MKILVVELGVKQSYRSKNRTTDTPLGINTSFYQYLPADNLLRESAICTKSAQFFYTTKKWYDLTHCQPRYLSVKKGENMDCLNPIAVWTNPNDGNSSVVLHKLGNGTYATHLYHRHLNQLSFGHYHGKDLRSAWYDYQARTKAEL